MLIGLFGNADRLKKKKVNGYVHEKMKIIIHYIQKSCVCV